jgi:hypothetical protein
MVFAAEALDLATLVLKRTPVDAVRHADVKRSRAAANDVSEILMIPHIVIVLSISTKL